MQKQIFYLHLDVYPDAFVEFNLLSKDSFLVKLWSKVNRKVFPSAEKIYTLTEGMKDRLSNYVDPNKIKVVPVWSDNNFLKPFQKI